MLFEWDIPHLRPEETIREVRARRGLIPVDIDVEAERMVWFDVGDYHFDESFFFLSTKKLKQQEEESFSFTSGLDVLDSDEILDTFIHPTGFIFHGGRCGSTLLAKALARSPRHLVISEAPPHFLIWSIINADWLTPLAYTEENKRRYRALILATGRKRRPEYRAHFIKFTTFNVLFLDFIRAVFPDVSAIFLYRDPAEVLVGFADRGPGWEHLRDTPFGAFVAGCTLDEVRAMSRGSFHAHFLSQYMAAALEAPSGTIKVANYTQLTRDNLAIFLQALNCPAETDDLAIMGEQFDYYAKEDDQQVRFTSDTAEKRRAITPEIEMLVQPRLSNLYERLEAAENNLFRRSGSEEWPLT